MLGTFSSSTRAWQACLSIEKCSTGHCSVDSICENLWNWFHLFHVMNGKQWWTSWSYNIAKLIGIPDYLLIPLLIGPHQSNHIYWCHAILIVIQVGCTVEASIGNPVIQSSQCLVHNTKNIIDWRSTCQCVYAMIYSLITNAWFAKQKYESVGMAWIM